MKIPTRRKYQRQQHRQQHNFYFLSALILLAFIGIDSSGANLYSEFSKNLDVISNLAENKVKSETAPIIDEIYERSGKLLENPFVDVLSEEDMENLERIVEVEKLTDVIEPEYSSFSEESSGKQIFRRQDENEEKFKNKNRNNHNILGSNLHAENSIFRESDENGLDKNIWPYISQIGEMSSPLSVSSCSKVGEHSALNGKYRFPSRSKREKIAGSKILRKRFNVPLPYLDPKTVLNSASSLYPGVMAKQQLDLKSASVTPNMDPIAGNPPINVDLNALTATSGISSRQTADSPSLPSLNQMKELQDLLLQHTPHQVAANGFEIQPTPPANCEQMTANVSNALERVLTELEKIKDAKTGNLTADGAPCNINGFWNSEVAGVRFDISIAGNDTICPIDLNVDIKKRRRKQQKTVMDTTWTCRGSTLKRAGGPFYLTAKKKSDNGLATFTGFCMKCEECDVIFGAWIFANPCNNCTDVSLAIETKRDVFRRDMEEERKARGKDEKEKSKTSKKTGCLSEGTEGQDQSEYHEGFSSDTFYEYF